MTAGPAERSRAMRLAVRIGVPILVGLAGTLAAAQYPASDVPGGVGVGLRGLASLPTVVLPFHPSLSWAPHHRGEVLTVHPQGRCRVHLASVTSTAPGRIEVTPSVSGTPCRGRRTIEHFHLPLPTVQDPRRNVRVDVGDQVLYLHWARRPRPHPPGSNDA